MDDGGFDSRNAAGTSALRFQARRPFEICYAHGKGLVSSAEIDRMRPNHAEYLAAVNGRDLPRVAATKRLDVASFMGAGLQRL